MSDKEEITKIIKMEKRVNVNSYKKNRNRIEALESEVKEIKSHIKELKEESNRISRRISYQVSKAA